MIHSGVQSRWPHPKKTILIIDIGGGSAEFIISRDAQDRRSLFAENRSRAADRSLFETRSARRRLELRQLDEYIEEKLAPIGRQLDEQRPQRTIATSATAAAVACALHRVPRARRDLADRLRVPRVALRDLFQRPRFEEPRAAPPGAGYRPAARRGDRARLCGAGASAAATSTFRRCSIRAPACATASSPISRCAASEAIWPQLDGDQLRSVRDMARRYRVSLKHGDNVALLGRQLFAELGRCHELPPADGKLLGGGCLSARHWSFHQRHPPPPALVLCRRELRSAGVYRPRTAGHRPSLPVPSQVLARSRSIPASRNSTRPKRSTVRCLTPLLRIADSLDRGHQQRVRSLAVKIDPDGVVLYLESPEKTDLEVWARATGRGRLPADLRAAPDCVAKSG